jgi:hypothetical protein
MIIYAQINGDTSVLPSVSAFIIDADAIYGNRADPNIPHPSASPPSHHLTGVWVQVAEQIVGFVHAIQ